MVVEARRWRVSGRVQGVFFRESTRRQAEALGLAGHAVNRPDGTVDILASGAPEQLDALARWLQRGPPLARVDELKALPAPTADEVGRGFVTD